MKVTVIDRAAQSADWGHGLMIMERYLRTVEIGDKCPKCGGERGTPYFSRFCEEGDFYSVSNWSNPCGHVDMYEEVLAEARTAARTCG